MRYFADRLGPRHPVVGRSARRLRAVVGLCAVAAAVGLSGCGESPNPPIAFVQNYLNALGGGDYSGACAMVDPQSFASLARAKHAHVSCAKLFARCLPNRSVVNKKDQTQLLYANINVTLSDKGKVADADTSATTVATELKHVTLKHENGVWKFTGLGRAIEACHLKAHKHKPHHKARHKH